MRKFILFIIFFPSVVTAQFIYEDEQIFNFFDEFNDSEEITIGKNPWATDGIDSTLGEAYISQVPQGQFGVRFQLPPDTSITTVKDIRFGCYWATGFNHLIDLSYASGSTTITVEWTWGSGEEGGLYLVYFYNPYTGELLDYYSWSQNTEIFVVPSQLDKIQLSAGYSGTLSAAWYEIYSPNGGETIEGGSIYTISYDGFYFITDSVDIAFSSDSGETWNSIVENYWSSNEIYEWSVPIVSSENCLIRLGDYPCNFDISDSVFTITYPVQVNNETDLPKEFLLSQNYPNPFNPTTKIKYTIPIVETRHASSLQMVTLKIYDILGNEVAKLVNEEKPAGEYEVEFDGSNLPSGIYFYQLKAASFIQTKKMVLLK